MKILAPIDGTEHSNNALSFLAQRTTLLGIKPNFELFCVDTSADTGESIAYDPKNAKKRVQKAFDNAKNLLKEDYDALPKMVGFGSPAESIVAESDRINADMIVIGTRGQGPLKGLLFGSVAQKVLSMTTRPVMVLRGKREFPQTVMNVGIAVDGTRFGPIMVYNVLKMAGSYCAYVNFHLLNVAEIPEIPQHRRVTLEEIQRLTEETYDKNTAAAQEIFKNKSVPFTKGILSGMSPGVAIARYADKNHLDLVIMGSHGYSPLQSMIFGSNTIEAASEGNVPMVIFHPSHYPDK